VSQAKATYPLRLPRSVKAEVERRAEADGISVNQFVTTAVAKKLADIGAAEFLAERRDGADFRTFDRLMRAWGGAAWGAGSATSRGLPEVSTRRPQRGSDRGFRLKSYAIRSGTLTPTAVADWRACYQIWLN
jgi:hypothetical protein